VVFSVSKTGALSALFPLDATTGYQPMGELIQPTSGTFVGTAAFAEARRTSGLFSDLLLPVPRRRRSEAHIRRQSGARS
jgi:hypothetical protein